MSKSDQQKRREERLAAKLRENLKRRKLQAKAREGDEEAELGGERKPSQSGE